jgi:flagellin
MSGIGGVGQSLNSISQTQQSIGTSFERLATGKRINSAADDPSGLAIYNQLQAQVDAYNVSSNNVQEAFNAATVAGGALQTTSDNLSRLRDLAVQASDDLLSPTQRAAIQTEANALVAETNTIAQNTTFNGTQLLNGSVAGPNAGTPAAATVANNDQIAQGGGIVTQVTAASANFQNANGAAQGFGGTSTQDSTIQIQIVNNGGVAQAVATVTDSATHQQVQSAAVSSGGVVSGFENVNVQLGNFSLADVGTTATIQISQNVAANTQNNALQVQSGPSQGDVTQVGIPAANSSTLRIANLDFSSSATATNAIGQLDNAIQQLSGVQANIGATQVSLQEDINNNNIAAVNTQSSASSIGDANVGSEVTNATKNQIEQQVALAVLAQRNTQSGAVLALFGH